MSIEVANEKAVYLQALEKHLNADSLKILADLSKSKNIDQKIKSNANLIRLKLAVS